MSATNFREAAKLAKAVARAAYRAPAPRAAVVSDTARDDEIRDKALEHFRAQRAAINAGTGRATTDACNSLLDFLEAAPEFNTLVCTALSCDAAVTGAAFQALLRKVMLADAEAEALRDLRQLELERED
jgi:hypothetical protein